MKKKEILHSYCKPRDPVPKNDSSVSFLNQSFVTQVVDPEFSLDIGSLLDIKPVLSIR